MSDQNLREGSTAHGLIQTARGLCTDEAPHVEIDALLGKAVDAVKDVEAERDRPERIGALLAERDRLREALRLLWDWEGDDQRYVPREIECAVRAVLEGPPNA